MNNYQEVCKDCMCLISDDKSTWICDELDIPCQDIVECPEQSSNQLNTNKKKEFS